MWFFSRRQDEVSPKPLAETPQLHVAKTPAQPAQTDLQALADRLAILSSRVTAVELDLDNIRNKVLRREQSKPQRSRQLGGSVR